MHAIRTYIVAGNTLFAQGVGSLLDAQPDIQVVGLAEYSHQTLQEIEALRPDVVIVDSGQYTHSEVTSSLLGLVPGLKIVGLSLDEDNITITYLQQKTGAAVEDLAAAVRDLPGSNWLPLPRQMRILAAIQGPFGQRVMDNVRRYAPAHWNISIWRAPPLMPPDQDSLATLLPKTLPAADLVLGLGESPQVARLLPQLVTRGGARAVLAPIENPLWLPPDVANELRLTFEAMGVAAAFPKPFCSLTMRTYNEASWRITYQDAHIAEFARYFGRPELRILFDEGQHVSRCEVRRDVACGFGRYLAGRLVGCPIEQAENTAGQLLLDHHYCPDGKVVDQEYRTPLFRVADSILREAVRREVAPFIREVAS